MRVVTWNINGLRSAISKGLIENLNSINADIICLQETKIQKNQMIFKFPNYYDYHNFGEVKGYAGVSILTKIKPINIFFGVNNSFLDNEGRVITLEFLNYYLVNVYVPHSGKDLSRLNYRLDFDNAFKYYIQKLLKKKEVIICGDMNVAHSTLDLSNSKQNIIKAGFSDEERENFSSLLSIGLVDIFRFLKPNAIEYTWHFNGNINNDGWRIDYVILSQRLVSNAKNIKIIKNVHCSDHFPIAIDLD